jgi:DNA-binding FrmR family transcriptional regulator
MHNHGHTCSPDKARALKLAKQAQGTLAKVIKMIEDDVYCPEIIQQADSALGLQKTMRRELLSGHLDSCAFERLKENKKEAIDELMKIYNLNS